MAVLFYFFFLLLIDFDLKKTFFLIAAIVKHTAEKYYLHSVL